MVLNEVEAQAHHKRASKPINETRSLV